ncbi:MAG TPA: tetratricopeptide repeat protein, partial [Kofleriaceae bacterium]
ALAMHLEDARATWDRALARFDRSGGEDALGVATVLVDLLSVSTEQRDLAAADRYLARLQSLAATAETRPDNLGVQIRVAQLVALREPARGIALAEDLAKRSDAALGRNSRTSASAYESLGYMYSDAKRFADAKTAFERTVEASRALYGERNPTTIDTEERFNQLLVETGDLATARPNLERLELALEQTQPKDSAKLANAELNLADCMLRQNDLAKAEDFARRSLAIRETRGDDPLQTSEARFLLAQVIWKARKEPTAIAFATKARDEMKAIGPRASTLPDVEQFLKQARAR